MVESFHHNSLKSFISVVDLFNFEQKCGAEGTRTLNNQIANLMLDQLSYRPKSMSVGANRLREIQSRAPDLLSLLFKTSLTY